MGIRIYNTMTRSIENFKSIEQNKVGMYACGITVYDEAHIGHAMQAIIFDIIRNYLEYRGYEVNYVRNFTDIDDKIINRAINEGVEPLELSSKYIKETRADLDALNVKPATEEPKISDFIQEIIDFISGLIEKDIAYPQEGDVLFDVHKFPEYGKLSNRNLDELQNKDTNVKKRNPQDFALWKAAKPGEPTWESPWGPGRPGWHIECSVMARHYLGDSFDIHGGGIDLIFPHHENEIAQSESLTGKTMANYWIHNGLIMVEKQKMSKSLGNFYTIKDALKKFSADEIRYVILCHTYNSNIDFSEDAFRIAKKRVLYFYKTLKIIDEFIKDEKPVNEKSSLLLEFENAMDDNFNTSKVMATLSNSFSEMNALLALKKKQIKARINEFIQFRQEITIISKVIGFLSIIPNEYLEQVKKSYLADNKISESEIKEAIEKRKSAKANKNYDLADSIRNEWLNKGIQFMDTPNGTIWELITD